MSASENKLAVRGFIEHVLNKKDFAAIGRYVSPEAVERLNCVTAMYALLAAIPDFHLHIELMIGEDDYVGVITTLSGSHEATFAGAQATGAGVSGRAAFCFRLVSGKIAETWAELEPWGLLPQLGIEPFAALPKTTFA